jgi:hypothetical protein
MEEQVIDCVSDVIDWANQRIVSEDIEWEDAAALSLEFKEWLEEDEIDLLYLDRLD